MKQSKLDRIRVAWLEFRYTLRSWWWWVMRPLWLRWVYPMKLRKAHCEKCGKQGVTEEGMDDFAALLCRGCYDRLWAEYERAVFEGQ